MNARYPFDGGSARDGRAAEDFRNTQARAVLDQVPGGVLVLDASGIVVHANGIAELRLDTPRGDLVGRDLFRDFMSELEEVGLGQRYRSAMDGVAPVSLTAEVRLATAAGTSRLGLGIRSLVLDGVPWGLVLVEDRTVLAAERDRRRQAERMAAVGELATGVAHEINNPLATIRGFTQLLSRELSGEQRQALDIIDLECGRIAKTIQNLQEFIKRQETVESAPIDLSALVEEVVTLKRYALETSGIELELDLASEPSRIVAEPDAVQRVVLSLLMHAEEVLHERETDRRLTVRTRESTEGVSLHVIDNGPGVPRDRLRTLLSAPIPGKEDLPLGLDAAAALTREQGGQIWADSAEDRGTAFFVRFPRIDEEPTPQAEPVAMLTIEDRPLRVLIADDEPALRMAISLFLGREGHEVVEAGSASEALRYAREQPFDVALIDIRMPGDGLALLDALDAMPSLEGRTVLMTGDAGHPRVRGRLGASQPLLIKPFDMVDAVQLVETLARGR